MLIQKPLIYQMNIFLHDQELCMQGLLLCRGLSNTNFTLMVVSVLTKMFYLAEGLAVGVGFGAIGKTTAATFENARYQQIFACLFVFEELLLFQTAINHSSFFHLKLVYPGRIVCNFVIRALNCRAGGCGFNPKGYTNTQGLKKSEK